MQHKTTGLKEVTVTIQKPFIQKLSDRIVVNVENSIISAGSTALDVLQRSPGVTVSQDDVISLRGKSGVIIKIDGKPGPMTGADLANYLKGLPSSAMDRVDIIANPSAKYEAAGNSGIIDIHMKKDQRLGANGIFTTSYGRSEVSTELRKNGRIPNYDKSEKFLLNARLYKMYKERIQHNAIPNARLLENDRADQDQLFPRAETFKFFEWYFGKET